MKARQPALGVEVLEGRRVLSAAPTPPPIGPNSIPLIQQSSLSGWHLTDTVAAPNWTVNNSVLTCSAGGPSIVTDQKFSNFNFHAEFSVPAKANSGFFLRDCYEIQVLDSQWRDANGNPAPANCTTGSIYSLIAPSPQTYVGPNQWNTVDATLVGTTVSVWLNNVLVIDQQTLTRASQGSGYPTYDSGPILVQSYNPNLLSSTVGLRIRNLYVTPLPSAPTNVIAALAGGAAGVGTGFVPIFNGVSLDGWEGKSGFWTVENGAIVGQTTAGNPTNGNTFLIWRQGRVDDFELQLKYRVTGGNSGIQYRSKDLGGYVVGGYQADFEAGTSYSGILYEENGRGILAHRGERVAIAADGTRVVGSPIGKSDDLQKVIKQGDWNDYRIVAKGPVLQHFINGRLMSEVVDDQVGKRAAEGILAIQLHDGPPMKVEVKDIRLDRAIGNGQAALKWAAPMGNSGSPITDYAVQYSSNGGTSWTTFTHSASTSTTATVTGLTNGTSYVFRVAAVNAAGTGSWSTKSSPITPRTVSSPPTNVIGIPTDRQVALRWIAPSSNGGSPITDYAVQYSSNGGGSWTTYAHPASKSTTATVTGLTNGTSYMFRVAAVNAAGTGNYSASTARVTPLAASPGRPTVVAGNGYVDLRWTAPALPSTPPITDYTIRYSADNGVTWSLYSHTATTATSSRLALANGITYTFQVAPVVSGGMGNSSVSSLPITPYSPTAVPSSPSGVAGVKTGTGVTLSWKSVPGNAGGPVSDYVVQYRINLPDSRWLTYVDSVTSATSANLVIRSGYSYVFRIAAKNLAGVGAYSTQSSPVSA